MKTVLRETADDAKLFIRVAKWNSTTKRVLEFYKVDWATMWKVKFTANVNRVKKKNKLL